MTFKKRIFPFIGIVLVSAIGISRIYLGLHYPVQVIGGAVVGLAFVALASLVLKRIPFQAGKMQPLPHLVFSLLTVLPLILSIILLGTAGDTTRIGGYLFGFAIGALFEERYVDFRTDTTLTRRIIRIIVAGVVGATVLGLLSLTIQGVDPASVFLNSVLQGLTIVLVIPSVFKIVEPRS